MNITKIIANRPHVNDEIFIGEVIVRDRYGTIIQIESFKSRAERKQISEKITTLYKEKLKYRKWTLSILIN